MIRNNNVSEDTVIHRGKGSFARPEEAHTVAVGTTRPGPVYASSTLFRGAATVTIDHGGEHYTLRHTRQGKLILTK